MSRLAENTEARTVRWAPPSPQAQIAYDLDREAICLFGLAFDRVSLEAVVQKVDRAIDAKVRLHLATPNANLMRMARQDSEFRDALLAADLSVIDGMPIVWLARLAGLGRWERVAGSDVFEALTKSQDRTARVCFFGGTEESGAILKERFGDTEAGVTCTGAIAPGFGAVEQLSASGMINAINRTSPDLVAVSVSAHKGLLWIRRNERRLQAPVIANLGATIHFAAGTIARAPQLWRKLGFEWLWRIVQEPVLARRYASDLGTLLTVALVQALPLAVLTHAESAWRQIGSLFGSKRKDMLRVLPASQTSTRRRKLVLAGPLTVETLQALRSRLKELVADPADIEIDLHRVTRIDAHALGLLLVVRGQQLRRQKQLHLTRAGWWLRTSLWLQGCSYLLPPREPARIAAPEPATAIARLARERR